MESLQQIRESFIVYTEENRKRSKFQHIVIIRRGLHRGNKRRGTCPRVTSRAFFPL